MLVVILIHKIKVQTEQKQSSKEDSNVKTDNTEQVHSVLKRNCLGKAEIKNGKLMLTNYKSSKVEIYTST